MARKRNTGGNAQQRVAASTAKRIPSTRQEIVEDLRNVAAGGKPGGNRINEAYAEYRQKKEQEQPERAMDEAVDAWLQWNQARARTPQYRMAQDEAAEREASGYVSPENYAASIRANQRAAGRIRAGGVVMSDGRYHVGKRAQEELDRLAQSTARSELAMRAQEDETAMFRGSDYWLQRANELEQKRKASRSGYGGMMQGGAAFRETPEFTAQDRQDWDKAREYYYQIKNAERWGSMPEDLRQKALEAAGYVTDSVLAWQDGDEAAMAGMTPDQRAQIQRDQRARRNQIAAILAGAGYEPEEVIEYASRVRNAERMQQEMAGLSEDVTGMGAEGVARGVYGTVQSYATNLLSPIGSVGLLTQKLFRGGAGAEQYRPVDYNTPSMYFSQGTSAIRGAVGGQMGDVGRFVYDTVNSAVDSGVRMLVGQALGGGGIKLSPDMSEEAAAKLNRFVSGFISTQMSGEVFANSFVQAKQSGSTDADALLDSVTSAVIEGLTEKYSVESILKNPNGLTWTALRNSFLAEGSEEMASDFLNTVYDELKNGDDSELRTQYRELLASGATEDDAFNRVFGDYVKQVVLDGLAGGLSGIAMSGVAEYATNKRYEKAYADPADTQALLDEARAINPDSKLLKRAEQRVAEGKGVTGYQARELMGRNEEKLAPLKQASAKYGKQSGAMQATYQEGQDVAQYDMSYRVAYEMGKAGTKLSATQTSTATDYLTDAQKQAAWSAGRDARTRLSDVSEVANGRALLNGQIVQVQTISARDGKLMAEVRQGESAQTVALDSLKVDAGTRTLAEGAKQYGSAAGTIFEQYKAGQDVAAYLRAADMAAAVGMASPSASSETVLRNLQAGQLGKALSGEQITAIYKAGQTAGRTQLRKTGMTRLGTGTVTFEQTAKGAKLNAQQKASVQFIRDLAKVTGIDFTIYKSSADSTGRLQGANGAYRDGTVHVDLNAGAAYAGKLESASMLRTVSHELTHYMAEAASTEFSALQDFMVQRLSQWEGHSIQDLVEGKMATAEQAGHPITAQEALEEVVADGCEMMLRDSKAVQQLAEENRTLFEKVRDWMKKFFESLRKAFEGVEAVHPESIHMMENYAGELQKLWDEAFTAAVKNAKESGQKNSARTGADVRLSVQDGRLTAESTEQERYELLKDASIRLASVNEDAVKGVRLEDYNTRKKSAVIPGFRALAKQLGILNVDLQNSEIGFPFQFSGKNLEKSLHHQLEYGGTYQDYVRMMSCFNDLVENAVPIEVHTDKKAGTVRENKKLKQTYVLTSAYRDGSSIVPVQLEVKEFHDTGAKLYLDVVLTKIEAEVLGTTSASNAGGPLSLLSASAISLRQLFENVNPADGRFLKYVPDGFLNEAQKNAKAQALRQQEQEYAGYGAKFSDRDSAGRELSAEQTEAEKRFGTTTDFNEAGFILPDGKMLRFTDDANAGARNYDHRAIGMMYGVDVDLTTNHGFNMESNRHMNRFVEDGGIRFDPGDPDYDMGAGMQLSQSKPLTKAQERTIRDFIAWKQERDAAYVPPDEFAKYMGAQAPLPLTIEFGGGADIAVDARSRDLAAWNVPHLTYEGGQINADRVIADIRHYYETGELRKPSEVARFRYSERVTDKKTLDFLNRQKTVKTYKTMQLVDGKLYPPMAARTNGQYEDYSVLGQWEQATEHPELVRDGKYKLDKGKGQGSISAAYNPYMHSSNLVLNDQFSGAYARPNLVTVECEVPVSELTSGYRADGAKDAVGWHAWHTGTVAGQLRAKTGTERQVLLSRWIKPVRILPDAEVAQMYKRLLGGTDIAVPDNVVTPSLLRELRKAGVSIKESGRVTARNAQEGAKFSDRDYSYDGLPADAYYTNGRIYDYDFLTAQKDMTVVENLPELSMLQTGGKIDTDKVVKRGFLNVLNNGGAKDGTVFRIRNAYTGRELQIGKNSITHGLGNASITSTRTNARLGAVIGELCRNAIPINGLENTHNVAGTYVMAALVNTDVNGKPMQTVALVTVERRDSRVQSVEAFDVAHAVSGRLLRDTNKENRSAQGTPAGNVPGGATRFSTVSIPDFLRIVNSTHQGFLSDDVIAHLGETRRGDGERKGLFQERDTVSQEIATLQRDLRQMRAELKRLKGSEGQVDLAAAAQYDAREALRAAKADAQEAREQGILAGQMAQGRQDAKAMSRLEAKLAQERAAGAEGREALRAANRDIRAKDKTIARNDAAIQRLQDRIARTEERLNDRIAEQRQRLTDYRENRNETEAARRQRAQIEARCEELTRMLTQNNDKQHIPEPLKQPVKELLEALTPSRFSQSMQERGTETQTDARLVRSLEKIRRVAADQAQGKLSDLGYLDLPPEFLDDIDDIFRFVSDGQTEPLYAMNSAQLKELNQVLTVLTTSIKQINRLITAGHFESVRDAAEATALDLNSMRERKLHFGLDSKAGKAEDVLRNFLSWKNTTPYYAFRRFGEGGQDMFRRLADGWDRLAFNSDRIIRFAEDTYTEQEVKAWEKEKHTVTLDSGEVITLSTANAMELYELSKREQAQGHLYGGGVRISGQGIRPVLLTAADVENIAGLLSERQKAVADRLQQYMEIQGSAWGNEVSMKRFGYRYFTEPHYYPVVSDSNELIARDTEAQENSMFRLLNLSATKGLREGANNAIVIGSIFDTFANHMSDMAKYNALALPILDTMKWFNYRDTVKNGAGQLLTQNVKQSIEAVYGSDALRYFTTFIKDLNGVSEGGRGEGFANRMISNYKVAAVAANLRVALLQPTAYVRAANVISPKYLTLALKNAPKALWNASGNVFRGSRSGLTGEMLEHSGIALWKSLGFYDTNIGRGVREQIKNAAGIKEKVVEKSMSLAELGDTSTWTVIWSACKLEQKAKGYTGQALLQQTAERFREVVYATQVVDSTMTRSHMMRSKSTFSKLSTAFMSEPTLSYNMLLDAAMGIQEVNRRGGNGWKAQGGKLLRAFTVFASTAAASALVESLFDAFRDDDDEDAITKFINALFGEKLLDGNLGQNLLPIGSLPYLKDAISILQGYSNERMDTEFISKIVNTAKIWAETYKLETGELDKATKVTSYGSMTTWGKVYKTLDALSSTAGLPLAATTREVTSIWNATIGAISPRMKIKRYESKDQKLEWLYSFAQSGSKADYEKELAELRRTFPGVKTEEEITESIQDGLRGKIKDHYLDGDLTEQEAQRLIERYTGRDAEEAEDDVNRWHYQRDTGDTDASASMAAAWYGIAEPAGIDREAFAEAWAFHNDVEADKDSSGKTVPGSKKQKVVDYIQGLGLSRDQEKALWDALKGNWKDTDTPWE